MTRYLFPERDSDAVKETLEDHDNDEEHGLTARSQPEIRRSRTSDPDFASKENREASFKRRTSATTDKSLYSHVRRHVRFMLRYEVIWGTWVKRVLSFQYFQLSLYARDFLKKARGGSFNSE